MNSINSLGEDLGEGGNNECWSLMLGFLVSKQLGKRAAIILNQ